MKRTLLPFLLTAAMAVGAPMAAQAQNMIDRQASLDARIDAGVRDRSLTAAEAAQLRSEFKAIVQLETQYRAGGISASERADLDRRFDYLSSRIQSERVDDQFGGGQSINERQADLDDRIDAGVRDRSLTNAEAAQLRADFQAIVRLENQYRAGGLTAAERADLEDRFDYLSSRIRSDRNDDQVGSGQSINDRQADLDDRIDAGVRDRSLTNAEAAQLRAEFQAIVRLENQYRSGGLTVAERADLDRRFDALSSRIRSNRNDNEYAGQSINQRQASLDARIDAGVRDRSLTNAEAAQLRADFQALVRLENQYRVGGLTTAERADLDRRFDVLASRIQRERNDSDGRWTNLDQRQAQFNDRLARAVSDGRVSQRDATALRTEFSAIARTEASYRASPPGITNAERNDLNARFDRLEANYQTAINEGRYGGQYDSLWDYLFGISR